MLISIQTADPRPIYRQIVDEVRRAIVLDLLLADEPLPSVRQLSADLRVNPNTVQQAYRELEREGLVYVQRGRGTFVAEARPGDDDRRELMEEVARRALRETYRNGANAAQLIEAIHRVARNDPDDADPEQADGKHADGKPVEGRPVDGTPIDSRKSAENRTEPA